MGGKWGRGGGKRGGGGEGEGSGDKRGEKRGLETPLSTPTCVLQILSTFQHCTGLTVTQTFTCIS